MQNRKLKIALVAPLVERVPPRKYGGTERVIHALAEELVRFGHSVTLFASGDSQTSANLISVVPKSLRELKVKDLYGLNDWTILNTGLAYTMQAKFDVIHDHNGELSLPPANIATTPTVMTIHGKIENLAIYETLNKPTLIAISRGQTKGLGNFEVVHNGLMMENYPFNPKPDDYLLFVGRFSPEKGAHLAIKVAKELGIPLIMAAKIDKKDRFYFTKHIKPQLSEQIKWVGEVDEQRRNELMARALCLLAPVIWEEPFGLTIIEAQACGCPVIAFKRGSTQEVIASGKSGYVVETLEEMVEAVKMIDKIKRADCRDFALNNFSASRMAKDYEEIYLREIEKNLVPETDKKSSLIYHKNYQTLE